MKNVWRKLRDSWLDFWEDDELDMDKKHLSQHDKRSLLYGGFMIGAVTFAFISISIMAGNIWTSHRNQKEMEDFLGTVATYMATATDDEYEEITQTIRHERYRNNPEPFVQYYVAFYASAYLGVITRWVETGMRESSQDMALIAMKLFFIKPGDPIKL